MSARVRTRILNVELTSYRPSQTRWPVGVRVERRAISGGVALGQFQRAFLLTWRSGRS